MKLIDNNLKSFYVKGRLPQWAIWAIAAVLFSLAWWGVSIWARQKALSDLRGYYDVWTEDGILEQDTNYTCVPASLVMLLKDQDINLTTYDAAVLAGTDIRGTDGSGIINTGKHFAFEVIHKKIGFDEFMSIGLPAVVVFRTHGIRHAAYIKPMPEFGLIEVKDPVQGLLHFGKEGADGYFESEIWDVYMFRSTG